MTDSISLASITSTGKANDAGLRLSRARSLRRADHSAAGQITEECGYSE